MSQPLTPRSIILRGELDFALFWRDKTMWDISSLQEQLKGGDCVAKKSIQILYQQSCSSLTKLAKGFRRSGIPRDTLCEWIREVPSSPGDNHPWQDKIIQYCLDYRRGAKISKAVEVLFPDSMQPAMIFQPLRSQAADCT
jgi:hypothetical protein